MDGTTALAIAMFVMACVISIVGIVILVLLYKIINAFKKALMFAFTVTFKPSFKFTKKKAV